jgi:hypothetical protein
MQPPDIEPAENAGNRHESEERGDDEKEEVVPRIDRGKTEEEGYGNVKPTGPGEGQTSGTAIFFRIEPNISSLLRFSFSGRQMSLCDPTGPAIACTSPGAT